MRERVSQTASDSTSSAQPSMLSRPSSAEYIVSGIKQHKLALVIALLVLVGGAVGLGFYLRARTTQVVIESIAVMSFVNESGNADVEYLSDGMTETLINSLSQIPNLSVKARSSVFRYKGKEIDSKKIAAELNVQAILTGRVVQRGDQLTLNLELIDAQTENILWGNRYERKSSELVTLQSEIARDVSNKLKTKLSGADAAKVEKNYTANAEAYQLYLKGRFYGSKRTAKDAQKSIEYFQQAAAIDPNYALAYAGLAESNWFLALYSYPQVNEVVPKARELALRALELDSSLAEPHSVLGVICLNYDHDFACMERETKLAIELNPNYSEAHRRNGMRLIWLGKFEEASIETKRALEIDPLSPTANIQYEQQLFFERKYEEAETQSKKNVELDPNFWYAHLQLFCVYRMKRDYAWAVEELAKVQDARGEPDAAKLIRESFAKGDWQGFLRKITEQRDSVIKSLHSLIYEPAPQIRDLNPSAPAELQRIVGRCLEKDADERYQTIKDVGIELKNLRREMSDAIEAPADSSLSTNQQASLPAGANILRDSSSGSSLGTDRLNAPPTQTSSIDYLVTGIKRHKLAALLSIIVVGASIGGFAVYRRAMNTGERIESIAVMPFVNASGNADVEYLSDGMTETLISSLSHLPKLNVKARSSVFRYKGKETNPQTIGKELNVKAVLNGRVLQRGDQLTLSLELIDARTENVIWSEQYNRKQTDLVLLQSEIARDVSGKLKSKLSGADEVKVTKSYTTRPEAYQPYLKGRFNWNKRTTESLKQAAVFYKQAIEKDPNYALAYAGLAETYVLFSSYSVASSKDSMPQAKAAAQRALELDESLAEAHTALGMFNNYYDFDRVAAEKEYRRAIELNPNYATAHHWLGVDVLASTKRFDEALAELRRAEELDPLSLIIGTNLGDTLVYFRRYDEAIAQYKRILSLDPNFAYAHQALGWTYGAKGMYPEAIAETRKYLELSPDPKGKGYLGLWLAKSGGRDEAMKLLDQLKQESTQRYLQHYSFVLIYIGLNEKEEAFNWLEKEISERSPNANSYGVLPELDDLRSDPRFKKMLKRLNLPE